MSLHMKTTSEHWFLSVTQSGLLTLSLLRSHSLLIHRHEFNLVNYCISKKNAAVHVITMLRCHSINAVHVMPFMCVTYHQIRFVWISVPPYCCVYYPHKPFPFAPNHSLTLTHLTESLVECHTRIKAWMSWKRSYHIVLSPFIRNHTSISNERSISSTIEAHKSQCSVHGVSIHFVWAPIFRVLNCIHGELYWLSHSTPFEIDMIHRSGFIHFSFRWNGTMLKNAWCLAVMLRCTLFSCRFQSTQGTSSMVS